MGSFLKILLIWSIWDTIFRYSSYWWALNYKFLRFNYSNIKSVSVSTLNMRSESYSSSFYSILISVGSLSLASIFFSYFYSLSAYFYIFFMYCSLSCAFNLSLLFIFYSSNYFWCCRHIRIFSILFYISMINKHVHFLISFTSIMLS